VKLSAAEINNEIIPGREKLKGERHC